MEEMCLKSPSPPSLTAQLPVPPLLSHSPAHTNFPSTHLLPSSLPPSLPLSLLSSFHPIWLASPCSLGRGVAKSSVAVLSNDAHSHPCTPLCGDIHPPPHRPTAAQKLGPLWLPLTGRKPNRYLPLPTRSFAAGSPAGKPKFCLVGAPSKILYIHTYKK